MKEVYELTKDMASFAAILALHGAQHPHFYWTINPAPYGAEYLDMEFSTHDIYASLGARIPKAYISVRYSCPEGIVFTAKTPREYMFELQEKCTGKLTIKADDDDWPLLQPLWLELRATLMRWEVIPKRRFDDLTLRQQEIAHLLADDFDASEIAQELGIALNTVKVHFRNIQNEWGTESRGLKLMQEEAKRRGYGTK